MTKIDFSEMTIETHEKILNVRMRINNLKKEVALLKLDYNEGDLLQYEEKIREFDEELKPYEI